MLEQAIQNVFLQLTASLEKLDSKQYIRPCTNLFNATIGQHVRHVIELFQCLEAGYETGMVNYENRKRDTRIETEKSIAISLLNGIRSRIRKENIHLLLETSYDEHSDQMIRIESNYYREIAYNLEHAIHHMALIRVGINEVSDIALPSEYGVASSTIKHQRSCAQ
jgi:hypothetical protein